MNCVTESAQCLRVSWEILRLGWLSDGWAIIWELLTCLTTGPGGTEGWAQLWWTGVMHVTSSCGLAPVQHNGCCWEVVAWGWVPETKRHRDQDGAVGPALSGLWSHEALFCYILLVIRVSKASPDLKGRITRSHCRRSCGMEDTVLGILGKIQSDLLCSFRLISLSDWLLFSLDNEKLKWENTEKPLSFFFLRT